MRRVAWLTHNQLICFAGKLPMNRAHIIPRNIFSDIKHFTRVAALSVLHQPIVARCADGGVGKLRTEPQRVRIYHRADLLKRCHLHTEQPEDILNMYRSAAKGNLTAPDKRYRNRILVLCIRKRKQHAPLRRLTEHFVICFHLNQYAACRQKPLL